ncbi:hypothetical protein VMCG_10331 [Cytospora schulzeri]|uniref:Uncharacterized protein n=1 Tax=Cytospora schulzeri TaxID=448051 RepID=A0A423VCL3_9PEZI|nr:hypothetical protein VMCG_10331 [Valsa malicola]
MGTASAIYTAATSYMTVDHRAYPFYPHPAIHGFNVPPGVYLSSSSSSSSPPDQHEALQGRKLRPTPRRLTGRTLYLPSHDGQVTHLPIYDFTREYRQAVRDEPLGSSRFKTTFGLMRKPVGDGRGASEVSYLVDFEPPEARMSPSSPPAEFPTGAGKTKGSSGTRRRRKSSSSSSSAASSSLGGHVTTHATVRRRMLYGGAEVGLAIPPRGTVAVGDGDVACTITPASTGAVVPLVTSYPLRPTVSKFGSSRNPWFTFTLPGGRTLQWQVHPVEHGLLRYTLVELPRQGGNGAGGVDDDRWWEDEKDRSSSSSSSSSGEEMKQTTRSATRQRRKRSGNTSSDKDKPPFSASQGRNQHLIRAIYHNVGLGFSLSQPFSEGALLLENDMDPEFEAVVVASLLGLLWRARGEECKPRKNSKSEGSALARKKSVSVVSVDEKEWASADSSSPSSPERRGLLGKILRRMS